MELELEDAKKNRSVCVGLVFSFFAARTTSFFSNSMRRRRRRRRAKGDEPTREENFSSVPQHSFMYLNPILSIYLLSNPSYSLFLTSILQSESKATIRTRKFISNRLLQRRQMVRLFQVCDAAAAKLGEKEKLNCTFLDGCVFLAANKMRIEINHKDEA
jgi:hypothetical protein